MNRTDRLYAIVEELRARAPRTMRAAELAERFEVTTRTIERDLLALQEAGAPIWARPGPGGGYGIHVETTLPPLNLTPAEATALATALAAAGRTPFAAAGRSALMKLAAVMAEAPKETAATLISRIRLAHAPGDAMAPLSSVIQEAILAAIALEITYRDAEGRETTRVVEPAGLFATRSGWYLSAWCRLRQAPRAFHLGRIVAARLTGERIPPRPLDALLRDIPIDMTEPSLM
ncbi:MAG: YafY family transcriptional regulator [Thermomicrobiales bacterium]|nr:YafY family transcriptional regulator [Thermomicrobiales bacterium]